MSVNQPEANSSEQDNHGFWPYQDIGQIKRAVKLFGQRNTKALERSRILARLQASGAMAAAAAPSLMDIFERQDITTRHSILDLFENILAEEGDLSEIAENLAKQLNHPNFGLRKQVAEVMIMMGPMAKDAIGRVMGCTRHALDDVRLAAVKVMGAIGPVCADAAMPRLRKMLETCDSDREMTSAVASAMAAINSQGDDTQAADSHAAGSEATAETAVMDKQQATRKSSTSRRTSSRRVSTRRIVQNVQQQGNFQNDEQAVAATVKRLSELTPQKRMQALLAGLQSETPATRSMAARVLQEYANLLPPFAEVFRQAYLKETDLNVKDRIADLLTMIGLDN